MATLVLVAGLPGSGKSHLIKAMRQRSVGGLFVEDYMKDSINHSARMRQSRHHKTLVGELRAGRDCSIADIEFVRPEKQAEIEATIRAEVPDLTIQWISFENEWLQCLANIDQRAGDNTEKFEKDGAAVIRLTRHYKIPEHAERRPVFRPNGTSSDRL